MQCSFVADLYFPHRLSHRIFSTVGVDQFEAKQMSQRVEMSVFENVHKHKMIWIKALCSETTRQKSSLQIVPNKWVLVRAREINLQKITKVW